MLYEFVWEIRLEYLIQVEITEGGGKFPIDSLE